MRLWEVSKCIERHRKDSRRYQYTFYDAIVLLHKALQEELNMGRMWRGGGCRRFHPIGDRMENEMADGFDVWQSMRGLDMEFGVYRVPAKEVIPYRIYPVLSPAWKADGYDELGIIYDRYLDLLVTYVVEGESETDGYAAAIVTYGNLDTFGLPRGKSHLVGSSYRSNPSYQVPNIAKNNKRIHYGIRDSKCLLL